MKKCLRWICHWLSGTGSMFSLCVVAYGAVCLAAGEAAVPLGMLASLLLASGAGTLLQLLFFSPRPFRRMGYSLRLPGVSALPCRPCPGVFLVPPGGSRRLADLCGDIPGDFCRSGADL